MLTTVSQLIKQMEKDDIEYVRCESININGVSISKLIPFRHFEKTCEEGLGFFCGVWIMTCTSSLPMDTLKYGFRNSTCYPYPETYRKLPWCKANTARVMFYPTVEKNLWYYDPRLVCHRLMKRLNDMGYYLYSAFEYEFQVFDANTMKTKWDGKDFCNTLKNSLLDEFMQKCERNLYQIGVDLVAQHIEYGPGQFEWPMSPGWNMEGPDNAFLFRNSVKEIAQQYNMIASFCTKPLPTQPAGSGAHYNFSLWEISKSNHNNNNNIQRISVNKIKNLEQEEEIKQEKLLNEEMNKLQMKNQGKKNKINSFHDPNSKDGLTNIAKYFIGGILHHMKALTVFANNTENCFHRTNAKSWCPGNATWGRENRTTLVRVKTNEEDCNGTYLEYRLPGAACNPYLVCASVIAAGIDGIKNKIEPPKESFGYALENKEAAEVPSSLNEALECLKKDQIIVDAFGEHFINGYIHTKEVEIKDLKQLTQEYNGDYAKAEQEMFLKVL